MKSINLASNLLFENIYTKLDAVKYIQKLQSISDALFSIKIPLEQVLDNNLTLNEKGLLLEYCKQEQLNIQDPVTFQRHIQMVKEELDKQPVLSLYLAFNPTVEFAKFLSDWFVRNFNQKYFLELEFKPEILGGVVLVSNGSYKDYSLKKLLEERYKGKDLIGITVKTK